MFMILYTYTLRYLCRYVCKGRRQAVHQHLTYWDNSIETINKTKHYHVSIKFFLHSRKAYCICV